MSTLIHQFIVRLIHEEKEKHPNKFPDYVPEPLPEPEVTDQDKQILDVFYESWSGDQTTKADIELIKTVIAAVNLIKAKHDTDVPELPRQIKLRGGKT